LTQNINQENQNDSLSKNYFTMKTVGQIKPNPLVIKCVYSLTLVPYLKTFYTTRFDRIVVLFV